MKLTLTFLGALALAFGGYAIGRAQTINGSSIEFGNTVLRLGMSKDSVIAVLARDYSVDDHGIVVAKSGPPYESLGSLAFKNERLTAVWKSWSPSNQHQGYEFANNIYGLFKLFQDEGRTTCTLNAGSKQTTGSEAKTAYLFCGGKEIHLDALRWTQGGQTNESAMLTEILKAND